MRSALLSRARQRLTRGQRYHFIAGWLPWLADGLNLLFNLAALGWSVAMIIAPHRIDPPLVMFSVLPLALFAFKLVKLAHLYSSRVGANIRQTFAAALAGLALSHTIGLAVVKGADHAQRTVLPHAEAHSRTASAKGFAAARQETSASCAVAARGYRTDAADSDLAPDQLIGIPEELKGRTCRCGSRCS